MAHFVYDNIQNNYVGHLKYIVPDILIVSHTLLYYHFNSYPKYYELQCKYELQL